MNSKDPKEITFHFSRYISIGLRTMILALHRALVYLNVSYTLCVLSRRVFFTSLRDKNAYSADIYM